MLSKGIAITSLLALPHVNAFFSSAPKVLDFTLKEHPDGSVHMFELPEHRQRRLFRLKNAGDNIEHNTATNVFKVHGGMYVEDSLELDAYAASNVGDFNFMKVASDGDVSKAGFVDKGDGIYECSICNRNLVDAALTQKYFATEHQLRQELDARTAADSTLTTNLAAEETRATTAEGVNAKAIADEKTRVNLATGLAEDANNLGFSNQPVIRDSATVKQALLDIETELHTVLHGAENELNTLLEIAEEFRELDGNLTASITALGQSHTSALSTETNARIQGDDDLETRLDALVLASGNNATVALDAEVAARKEDVNLVESELEGMLQIIANTLGISWLQLKAAGEAAAGDTAPNPLNQVGFDQVAIAQQATTSTSPQAYIDSL